MQSSDIRKTVDFYINTLTAGPVEDEPEKKPTPWQDAWYWNGSEAGSLPREGEPKGRIALDDLAEFESASYAGLGGSPELEICRVPENAKSVQGHPIAVTVDDVESLYELHRQRGVKIVQEIGSLPWGYYGYTAEDINGYLLRISRRDTDKAADYVIQMVPDLERTVDYYVDKLGFSDASFWGDPPEFACVQDPCIEFWRKPALFAELPNHMISVYVDDVDDLYRKHMSNGVKIVEELQDKPWEMRQYVIEDVNGYVLRFGGAE
jgi:catechol 2,3-dioxygenase-like lactoylglutathione lyase family enzyme